MEKEEEVSLASGSAVPELNPAPQNKRKRTVIKLVVAAAVFGVVLYLVFGGDWDKGQCDIFKGQWVRNPSGPSYNNKSCNFIDDADNCLKNGRPDTQYLYWRWQPQHCDLPSFDPVVFMHSMRNKSWAFIGDSILRNQMQSLVCLVSKVEEPTEVYHDATYKSRTMYFPKHNFTVATIWAPFLVKAFGDGKDKKPIQVYLDALEANWTTEYHKHDYVVIAGGQWFLKTAVFWENGKITGCHNCETEHVEEIGVYDPYRKALGSVFSFITSSDHKPARIVFRTWTTDHFEYGEWYSGGVCNRSQPYRDGQFNGSPMDLMMRKIEIEEYERARDVASKRGIEMELLDIFHLSMLRPDGHPGPYRTFHPFDEDKSAKVQNDCLHWCLPGPVDAWNDLMMKMLLNSGALTPSASYQEALQGLDLVSSL